MSISELIERVEGATGPDRELDAAICRHTRHTAEQPDGSWLETFDGGYRHTINPPALTASLDAALALCERVLPEAWPGFQRNRVTDPARAWSAWLEIFPEGAKDYDTYDFNAPTPALALILAMLQALQAKDPTP